MRNYSDIKVPGVGSIAHKEVKHLDSSQVGFPDRRPEWVAYSAEEIGVDHPSWPEGLDPQTHQVWHNDADGRVWRWPREGHRRYLRLLYLEQVCPEDMSPHARRELALMRRQRHEGDTRSCEQVRKARALENHKTRQPGGKTPRVRRSERMRLNRDISTQGK